MVIGDDGFELAVVVRLAEAAGMGELQPDDEIVVVSGRLPMRGDHGVAQARDLALAVAGHGELLRIGAAVGPHRAGLSAPDQLGAAEPEAAPAPFGIVRRLAVTLAVPALHRMDRQAMADLHAVDFDRGRQWRVPAMRDDVVARHLDSEGLQVIAKARDAVKRASLGIVAEFHVLCLLYQIALYCPLRAASHKP